MPKPLRNTGLKQLKANLNMNIELPPILKNSPRYRVLLFDFSKPTPSGNWIDKHSALKVLSDEFMGLRLQAGMIIGAYSTEESIPDSWLDFGNFEPFDTKQTGLVLTSVDVSGDKVFGYVAAIGRKRKQAAKFLEEMRCKGIVPRTTVVVSSLVMSPKPKLKVLNIINVHLFTPIAEKYGIHAKYNTKSTSKEPIKMAAARKPTAKQIFKTIKPVESKNVVVHFDKAFRVPARMKFDGYMKKLNGMNGVFVKHPDHGDDIFAIPYCKPLSSMASSKAMESSLRGALKSRRLTVVSIEDLKQ